MIASAFDPGLSLPQEYRVDHRLVLDQHELMLYPVAMPLADKGQVLVPIKLFQEDDRIFVVPPHDRDERKEGKEEEKEKKPIVFSMLLVKDTDVRPVRRMGYLEVEAKHKDTYFDKHANIRWNRISTQDLQSHVRLHLFDEYNVDGMPDAQVKVLFRTLKQFQRDVDAYAAKKEGHRRWNHEHLGSAATNPFMGPVASVVAVPYREEMPYVRIRPEDNAVDHPDKGYDKGKGQKQGKGKGKGKGKGAIRIALGSPKRKSKDEKEEEKKKKDDTKKKEEKEEKEENKNKKKEEEKEKEKEKDKTEKKDGWLEYFGVWGTLSGTAKGFVKKFESFRTRFVKEHKAFRQHMDTVAELNITLVRHVEHFDRAVYPQMVALIVHDEARRPDVKRAIKAFQQISDDLKALKKLRDTLIDLEAGINVERQSFTELVEQTQQATFRKKFADKQEWLKRMDAKAAETTAVLEAYASSYKRAKAVFERSNEVGHHVLALRREMKRVQALFAAPTPVVAIPVAQREEHPQAQPVARAQAQPVVPVPVAVPVAAPVPVVAPAQVPVVAPVPVPVVVARNVQVQPQMQQPMPPLIQAVPQVQQVQRARAPPGPHPMVTRARARAARGGRKTRKKNKKKEEKEKEKEEKEEQDDIQDDVQDDVQEVDEEKEETTTHAPLQDERKRYMLPLQRGAPFGLEGVHPSDLVLHEGPKIDDSFLFTLYPALSERMSARQRLVQHVESDRALASVLQDHCSEVFAVREGLMKNIDGWSKEETALQQLLKKTSSKDKAKKLYVELQALAKKKEKAQESLLHLEEQDARCLQVPLAEALLRPSFRLPFAAQEALLDEADTARFVYDPATKQWNVPSQPKTWAVLQVARNDDDDIHDVGPRYDLLAYQGRMRHRFDDELPPSLRDQIHENNNNNNLGKRSWEDRSSLYHPDVQLVYAQHPLTSLSVDGYTMDDKVPLSEMPQYRALLSMPGWREQLHDSYLVDVPFELDDLRWASVEHFLRGARYRATFPHVYYQYALDSGSPTASDLGLARSMDDVYQKLPLDHPPLHADKNWIRAVDRARALQAKFGSHVGLKTTLLSTRDAKLVRKALQGKQVGKENKVDTLLMETRRALAT